MFQQPKTPAPRPGYHLNRIAVQGCDNVAAASLYSLILNPAVDEIILVGKASRTLLSQVNRICRDFPTPRQVNVRVGRYGDLKDSRILVVAEGVEPVENESAGERVGRGFRRIRRLMTRVKASGFHGIVLMTTVPVDLMTQAAQQELGCAPGRVIGIGSTLESPRPAELPERRRSIPVAVWCSARMADRQQMDACEPDCPYFEEQLSRHHLKVPERRTSASAETATCVMRTCEAILRDEKAVFPVSAMASGQYGISGVYMHLPCVIGSEGAEKIVELPASEDVRRRMLYSARYLGDLNLELQKRMKSRKRRPVSKFALAAAISVRPARSKS